MKPRVVFLDHTGSLGGAELFLLDVARDNIETGLVVLLTDGPFRERLEEDGIRVEILPASRAVSGVAREGGFGRDLLSIPDVLKLARQVAKLSRGYDLLYANSQKALVVGALAGKIARKPVIWHQHDLLTADHFSRGHRRLAALFSRYLVDRVITCSKAAADALAEGGGCAERARVVYNGIDPSPFKSVTLTEINTLRRKMKLEGVPVVGGFSRLAPWKGQHVLLEALPYLSDVHALLVGEAIFGELAYAKTLRTRSKALGIEDRVHFVGFRRDIPQLMSLSDVVAHTSVVPEPFGRVIVESMLARTPVVATRAGGAVEIVDDGVNGILVPPGDAEALAKVLHDLLTNPHKASALAEAGYTTAMERFSRQTMLDDIAQQLQEVAAWR